ncbi:MAG: chemotaxis protein methyltransferase CheR [Thermoanaerobacteraceae bacterium]|jgi:chemotaxis protein methyltransferase CheR|nr:chemotaxis protein methyltransferase CheR [Thermoanaerobacteraceae bacterium]RKL62243.1 protein-glutamate O-methyltransferase CheR [Thermoanaerobacteraceae bacterium SP2]
MDTIGLVQLAELIYNYCGIDYMKNLSSLEPKISGRLKELGLSAWEYCGYLKMEAKEWDTLIELITVNETYFFREENLLDEIKSAILPQYKDRTTENPLVIWCAACSSGEEPYTIGMLVEESGLFQPGAVRIIASDINKKVLKKAKSGVYNKKSFSFRKMPEGVLDKFFIELEEDYKVKDSIMEMVDFRYMNLLDNNITGKIEKSDIILCRNVLIYFDTKAIQRIVDDFSNILKPGGYLFLGHAETITGMKSDFETIYTQNIFYYKKGGNSLCGSTGC